MQLVVLIMPFCALWPCSSELKVFHIYVGADTFVRRQFPKFTNVFSSRKFVMNFQMDLLKS